MGHSENARGNPRRGPEKRRCPAKEGMNELATMLNEALSPPARRGGRADQEDGMLPKIGATRGAAQARQRAALSEVRNLCCNSSSDLPRHAELRKRDIFLIGVAPLLEGGDRARFHVFPIHSHVL